MALKTIRRARFGYTRQGWNTVGGYDETPPANAQQIVFRTIRKTRL